MKKLLLVLIISSSSSFAGVIENNIPTTFDADTDAKSWSSEEVVVDVTFGQFLGDKKRMPASNQLDFVKKSSEINSMTGTFN